MEEVTFQGGLAAPQQCDRQRKGGVEALWFGVAKEWAEMVEGRASQATTQDTCLRGTIASQKLSLFGKM